MELDKHQRAAVDRAVAERFAMITGGAGTGKTTIIKMIADQIVAGGSEIALAAFAGKAAARLREACGHPASTIHRLLGYQGSKFMTESLADKCIVIDEASMVSADLMAELVRREPKKLILVGDPAQLAPVGKGQPFHDLLKLRKSDVAKLTKCYRASEAVYKAATCIRAGSPPVEQETSDNERWSMTNTGNAQQTQDAIMQWVEQDIFDWDKDIILCPKNGADETTPCTVKALNAAIVDIISPRREGEIFNVGDRVINTKNIAAKDVWNGTTGSIHAIDIDGGIWVEVDVPVIDWNKSKSDKDPVYTSKVLFDKKERKNLQLAYALTVHKSQGSQYRNVLFVALQRDSWALLDRSLIYTAITRTREACCVVGELAAFYAGIQKVSQKRTVLQEIG